MGGIVIKIRRVRSEELKEDNIGEYLPRGTQNLSDIVPVVNEILENIKKRGIDAVNDYTRRFDGVDLDSENLSIRVTDEEIEEAEGLISDELKAALRKAMLNIERFHKAQYKEEWFIETMPGVRAGQVMRPISDVGLYIPGGRAVYPSSVLMTAIPAKVAGVSRLVICTPPQANGKIAPAILYAARLCGVDEIYRCGGAQAIGLMAYGDKSKAIAPVKKIVGPGNKWVSLAKQLVSNICAIDNPAGPSEILVVADSSYPPLWSAYDLLAQSEHGPDNVAVLISEEPKVIDEISVNLEKITSESPRGDIIRANLEKYGLIIESSSRNETYRIINLISTEHLQLNVKDAHSWLKNINNAGAVFLGGHSPVPLGDYCAGTNHVLPTSGYAAMYSGLSLLDFVKVMDVLEVSPGAEKTLYPILKPIAEFEGLIGHRDCVRARLDDSSADE